MALIDIVNDPIMEEYLKCNDHELLALIAFALTDILCDVSNSFADVHEIRDYIASGLHVSVIQME